LSIRGSDLPRIRYRLLAVLVLSVLLTLLHERGPLDSPLTPAILSLMGLALGIFLGFRNNTSYDRYWEGRKLWGLLVNTSRVWARDMLTLTDGTSEQVTPTAFQTEQVRRIVGFAHALRLALRRQDHGEELKRWLSAEELAWVNNKSNLPDAILQLAARENQRAHHAGLITDYRLIRLAELLHALTDIQGGCERIRNTPIPHSYTIIMHRIVALYVFALPFGLVNSLHFVTPLVVLLVAYTFLGLDAVGDELEDPFGEDLNDLPLSTLCRTIEINLLEALGETNIPAPYPAHKGYLS
jgi:putative membrane protein